MSRLGGNHLKAAAVTLVGVLHRMPDDIGTEDRRLERLLFTVHQLHFTVTAARSA